MKNNKFYIILIAVLIMMSAGEVFSQTGLSSYITDFQYSVTLNSGKTSDYISKPGWFGFSVNYSKFIKRNVSAGITVGWNVTAMQEVNKLEVLKNGAVYGTQGRYFNHFPMLANVGYYFNNNRSNIIPYVKANAGVYYINQRLTLGVYEYRNDNWHFGVAPEVGVLINMSRGIGLTLSGKFNYAFDSGTRLSGDETNDHSFFNINLGIAYLK